MDGWGCHQGGGGWCGFYQGNDGEWLTKMMGDHYGGGILEACNGEDAWAVVDLENVGDRLEILDVVREEEEKEGQGRSPRDHLDLERSPLLSLVNTHNKKLTALTCLNFYSSSNQP